MSTSSFQIPCLVCTTALTLRLVRGRKSGKPFLMLICPADGRHFRGFITQPDYVAGVLARLESQTPDSESGVGLDNGDLSSKCSRTNLEQANSQ